MKDMGIGNTDNSFDSRDISLDRMCSRLDQGILA